MSILRATVNISSWMRDLPGLAAESDTTDDTTDVAVEEVVSEERVSDLTNWLVAGIVVVGAFLLGRVIRRLIRRLANRSNTVTSTVQIVSQLAFGTTLLLGLAIGLAIIGIDLTPLLAGAGILGLSAGFALKDIAENYVSGIIMGFSNPFAPGDQVVVDDGAIEGTVEELQLRYTVIRSTDGVRILVPNALVLKSPVENLTANGRRRSHFTLGVGFDTEVDEARRIAVEAVKATPGVLENPEPEAFVEELAGSWITIRVRFWHGPSGHDRWAVRGRAISAAFSACNKAGIDMPYRHQVVQVNIPPGTDERDLDGGSQPED